MKPLIIRTADFHLAWRLVKELRRRGCKFIQIKAEDKLPTEDSIWLGTQNEINLKSDGIGIPVILDSFELCVERAVQKARGFGETKVLTFGIDPGPRPGVAWIADGIQIGVATLEKIDDLPDYIIALSQTLQHDKLIIKIGDGSPTIRNRIVNCCLSRNLSVELVDERRTSFGLPRHHHHSAAVRIANIEGINVEAKLSLEPTEGELRELQRRSRKVSEGRLTISSNLAKAVAVGRLTMEEALLRQKMKSRK